MNTADIILNTSMALTVVMQCFNAFLVNSKRIIIYPLSIVIYVGYLVIEGWLAIRDHSIAGIGLFVIVDIIWIATAVHGWRTHGKAVQHVRQ